MFIADLQKVVVWEIEQSILCYKPQILHLSTNITTFN